MRILKVWDSDYPWDVRTEKVCRALTDMGHDVHMVARNRERRPTRESLEECTIHRMAPWSALGFRLDAASQFPAFFNPRWSNLITRTGREIGAELILVRDIPLGPTAIRAGRRLGIPVILDMAENYAAMIRDIWTTGTTKLGDSLVRNPKAVATVERWVLDRIDHTLVVVQESKDRLVSMGVPDDAISIVSNTPSLERVEEFARIREERRDDEGRGDALNLVYLGLMEEPRGVGTVIEAVADAREQGTPVTLDLIGAGRSLATFRARAEARGLSSEVVRFHGFVPYNEALAIVATADAGLIPHYANESWETTIPNKLFDYMSLGVPVIASDVTPVKRVLSETGGGVTYRDRDRADLTRVFREMQARGERAEMGARGIRAVRETYHWEKDAEVLSDALQHVSRRSPAYR